MAVVAHRKPVMTLYSGVNSALSHRVRLVLAEKNIAVEIIDVDDGELPEDLLELNPYNSVPTLVDRDLVIYESDIIVEYLDERYPHPPLTPVDPVSRARSRTMLYRIHRDWFSLIDELESENEKVAAKARKTLREGLTMIAPIFEKKPYFMSDDFTIVDCSLAPLLWRLTHYQIELPKQAKPVADYANRLFERESFQASLSDAEREIGKKKS